MELLFVALGGVLLGLAAQFSLPGRDRYGVAVLPAVGAAGASALGFALGRLGLGWDTGWIWLLSLGGAALLAVASGLLLGRRRARADAAFLAAAKLRD